MIFKRRKQKETEYDAFGFSLEVRKPEREKSLFFLCLSKAILLFCLVFGSIWFYFSCFEIRSMLWLIGVVVALFSLMAGFLYYNKWTKNIGYVVVLLIFAGMAYYLHQEANSGFAAILNQTYEVIDEVFILPSYNIFSESYANRVFAVTVCAAFLGGFGCIFFNILISRHMSFWFTFLLLSPFLVLALYFNGTPAFGSVFLLAVAAAGILVFRSEHRFFSRQEQSGYRRKKRKKRPERYQYDADGRTMLGTLRQVIVSLALLFCMLFLLVPASAVHYPHTARRLKESTTEGVRNFFIVGLWGMLNLNQGTGGLSGGKFSNVSSVRPDYETDLLVTLVPYNYDRIYLRSYIGKNYMYGENRWATSEEQAQRSVADGYDEDGSYFLLTEEELADFTYSGLWEEYESGGAVEQLRMTVENVDADSQYVYLPYDTQLTGTEKITIRAEDRIDGVSEKGSVRSITYYRKELESLTSPELFSLEASGGETQRQKAVDAYVREEYLSVPVQLEELLADISQKADLTGSKQQITEKLIAYLQEQCSYTLRPGFLPWRTDFVTYFLKYNHKGYCAHFATAATLLFRYAGIPARYCEGYAIDYAQLLEGEMLEKEDYQDWYTGEAVWGETAVVRVEVPDAAAHGWVEIYLDGYGWVPVEVTPASTEEEEQLSFMESFFRMFSSDEEENVGDAFSDEEAAAGIDMDPRVMLGTGMALLFAGILWMGFLIFRKLKWRKKQRGGSERDQLLTAFCELQCFYRRIGISQYPQETFEAYFERIRQRLPSPVSCEFMIRTLDQAHYAPDAENADYQQAAGILKEMKSNAKKELRLYQRLLVMLDF